MEIKAEPLKLINYMQIFEAYFLVVMLMDVAISLKVKPGLRNTRKFFTKFFQKLTVWTTVMNVTELCLILHGKNTRKLCTISNAKGVT